MCVIACSATATGQDRRREIEQGVSGGMDRRRLHHDYCLVNSGGDAAERELSAVAAAAERHARLRDTLRT
jgi:hypothetical protein